MTPSAIVSEDPTDGQPHPAAPSPGKLPALQFYPGDWLKDIAVRSLSLAERGLWIDMIALMHTASRRGYLEHAEGRPVSTDQLARIVGETPKTVGRLLANMESVGVFSRDDAGTIFCRRLVRDEHKRQLCAAAGKLGGNPTLKRQFKGDGNRQANGRRNGETNDVPKQKPTASIAFASSMSSASAECSPPFGSENINTSTPNPRSGGRGPANAVPPPTGFDQFWHAYPRKVAKAAAVKAFTKLAPDDALLACLLAAIERQKASADWQKEAGQFVPYPASWLTGRRWEDIETPPPAACVSPGLDVELIPDGTPARGVSRERADEIFKHFLADAAMASPTGDEP